MNRCGAADLLQFRRITGNSAWDGQEACLSTVRTGITSQIPHAVHLALPRGAEEPRLEFPPLKTYRFSREAFSEGIEVHELDGVKVRIYDPEKTLADSFKFRNRIGLDTAIEALRLYRQHREVRVNDLMHYAQICRVEKVMRPYLEAIL